MTQNSLKQILSDLTNPKPEKQLKVEVDKELESVLAKLHQFYEFHQPFSAHPRERLAEHLKLILKLNLTPKIIEKFSLEIKIYENEKHFSQDAGLFLTALVQAAYAQKQNNFKIYTEHLSTKLDFFGFDLVGEKDRPLKISVLGDLGDDCNVMAYTHLVVSGTIGRCFVTPNKSKLRVSGKDIK